MTARAVNLSMIICKEKNIYKKLTICFQADFLAFFDFPDMNLDICKIQRKNQDMNACPEIETPPFTFKLW